MEVDRGNLSTIRAKYSNVLDALFTTDGSRSICRIGGDHSIIHCHIHLLIGALAIERYSIVYFVVDSMRRCGELSLFIHTESTKNDNTTASGSTLHISCICELGSIRDACLSINTSLNKVRRNTNELRPPTNDCYE